MNNHTLAFAPGITYQPVIRTIADLQKRGFHADFNLLGNQIFCTQTQSFFGANEFDILEMYSIDVHSNGREEIIIYGIECAEMNTRGILMQMNNHSLRIPQALLLQKVSKFWR